MAYTIARILPSDIPGNRQVDGLLEREGIRRDGNLDYTCGIFGDSWELVATGSCFGSTIRCLAVSGAHQGEGLLNQVISHLMEVQLARGHSHLFLYTKPSTVRFLSDLGFYEIARVDRGLVFMENRRDGFRRYCQALAEEASQGGRIAGIVMNANPFTLGHQHLVERAAEENDAVHLFVLSEEAGPIPFRVRKTLVQAGVSHLDNVCLHDSGPYMISSATFPSYFLRDADTVILAQAELDLQVFTKIAKALGITRRYAAQEPTSHVTALYNQTMARALPEQGIAFVEIPRLQYEGRDISASDVRQAIHHGNLEAIRPWVPKTTYDFFAGDQGAPIRAALRAEKDVIHY